MIQILAEALEVPKANIMPYEDWISRMKSFPTSKASSNPAELIVDFLDEHFVRMSCGGLIMDTTHAREHSHTLAGQGPVGADLVQKYVDSWKEMGFLE